MKLGLTIPDRLIPKAWRSDTRAIAEFDKAVTKGKKRVSLNLTVRRQFIANMQQDELKMAIMMAEDPLRPRRTLLNEYYRQTLKDGHINGEYEKAINKVVGSPFAVFKSGTDDIDELATKLLMKAWFEDYRIYGEEARFHGHSLVQFLDMVPSTEKGIQYEFKEVELINRDHVRPEEGYIVMDVSHDTGIPFRDEQFKKGLKLMEFGKKDNIGILQIAAKEFIWKNYSRSDWSRHSEKFGMPMLAIKAATTDKKELDALEQMARDFGNNLWMILDPEDEVDLKEPTFKDSYQIYKEKALFCNSEISKAFTWQTGTSDEKAFVGGAEVHERVLDAYIEARKRKQTFHVNDELFPFLIENGYPLKDREFRYLVMDESDPNQDEAEDQNADPNNPKGAGGRPVKKSQPRKGARQSAQSLLK
jgi:hypothetical protein